MDITSVSPLQLGASGHLDLACLAAEMRRWTSHPSVLCSWVHLAAWSRDVNLGLVGSSM